MYGVPIREEAFVDEFLKRKADKIAADVEVVKERMDPNAVTSPEIPAIQL